jgi:hypothetical protein
LSELRHSLFVCKLASWHGTNSEAQRTKNIYDDHAEVLLPGMHIMQQFNSVL